jgi:hypothetical protein
MMKCIYPLSIIMDGLYLPDLACLKAIKVMRESPSKIRFLASKEIAIFEANNAAVASPTQ